MAQPSFNSDLEKRIAILFSPHQREEVRMLLRVECGNNLPFCRNDDEFALNRIRFAALKLSDGDLSKLCKVVEIAKCDWRDLLVAAGFAEDARSHNDWFPEKRW